MGFIICALSGDSGLLFDFVRSILSARSLCGIDVTGSHVTCDTHVGLLARLLVWLLVRILACPSTMLPCCRAAGHHRLRSHRHHPCQEEAAQEQRPADANPAVAGPVAVAPSAVRKGDLPPHAAATAAPPPRHCPRRRRLTPICTAGDPFWPWFCIAYPPANL